MMLLSELVDTCQVLVVHSQLDALGYLVNCFSGYQLNVGADMCQVPGFITRSKQNVFKAVHKVPYVASSIKQKAMRSTHKTKTQLLKCAGSFGAFSASHIPTLFLMQFAEPGRPGEGNICIEEIIFTWSCKPEINIFTFKASQI